MKPRKFYTVGYRRLKLNFFVSEILARNLMVVDCRHYPFTDNDFNYHRLTEELGTDYRHVPALGNKHFRAGRLSVNELTTGMNILAQLEKSFVLLCACPILSRCHRSLIANALEAEGWELEDFPRLTAQAKKSVQLNLF